MFSSTFLNGVTNKLLWLVIIPNRYFDSLDAREIYFQVIRAHVSLQDAQKMVTITLQNSTDVSNRMKKVLNIPETFL